MAPSRGMASASISSSAIRGSSWCRLSGACGPLPYAASQCSARWMTPPPPTATSSATCLTHDFTRGVGFNGGQQTGQHSGSKPTPATLHPMTGGIRVTKPQIAGPAARERSPGEDFKSKVLGSSPRRPMAPVVRGAIGCNHSARYEPRTGSYIAASSSQRRSSREMCAVRMATSETAGVRANAAG